MHRATPPDDTGTAAPATARPPAPIWWACLATLIPLWLVAAWYHRPVDIGLSLPNQKLKSVSFAPFRAEQSPLKEIFPSRDQIAADLNLLATKTESVRTYASRGGLEAVPELARDHGLTVTQGAWLSWGAADNAREIAALVASANAHPDVVTRVIVGNEVLLRGELSAAQLIEQIEAVKRSVSQPVSYADVWSMYLKHPEIIAAVDFITIHILPYWEDEPVSIDGAARHLEEITAAVAAEARALGSTKPIFIGESGWPSRGRQRGFAVPSVLNAARYTRAMVDVATRRGFDYNIVEAFNQPWKSTLEGTVGAHWGLFSADRHPVYPLSGAIIEVPHWIERLLFVSALVVGGVFALRARLAFLPHYHRGLLVTIVALLTLSVVHGADHGWQTSYTTLETLGAGIGTIVAALLGVLLIQRVLDLLSGHATSTRSATTLRFAYLGVTLFALYRTYLLARHGRYISFPIDHLTVPVIGLVGLIAARALVAGQIRWVDLHLSALVGAPSHAVDRWLGWGVAIAIVALVGGETYAFFEARDLRSIYPTWHEALPVALHYAVGNTQLLTWAFLLGCLWRVLVPNPTRR